MGKKKPEFATRKNEPVAKMTFIIDTGSSDMWVSANKCKGCPGTGYPWRESDTIGARGTPGTEKIKTQLVDTRRIGYDDQARLKGSYVMGTVDGYRVSDVVRASINGKEVQDLAMVLASKASGMPDWVKADGFIGMMPERISNDTGTETIMNQFNVKAMLYMNMFSLHFQGENSTIWFGGYPKKYLKEAFPTQFGNLSSSHSDKTSNDGFNDRINWVTINKGSRSWTTMLNEFTIKPSRMRVSAKDQKYTFES